MDDQDDRTIECVVCSALGVVRKGGKPRLCSVCDGRGRVILNELADGIAAQAGGLSPTDPAVALARFEAQTAGSAAPEIEARFLADRGIRAKPGIDKEQLLPHQGGDISSREKELRLILESLEAGIDYVVPPAVSSTGRKDPVKPGPEVLADILTGRGIMSAPGVSKQHLLPHEGGEYSLKERDLRAVLEVEEGLQERFGPDLYRLYNTGQVSLSEAEAIAG